MENSKSLTSVPVFYQVLGENLPVFGQMTDAIHFNNICDSLETVFPDSKYVKALRKEADRRFGYLQLAERIASAEPVDFPDIELADRSGQQRKLSEVDSKVVLIYFWSATVPTQTMFNLDVLKPLYDDFHKKGFEIFGVSLDNRKEAWEAAIKNKELIWLHVSDLKGWENAAAAEYGVKSIPSNYLVDCATGQIVGVNLRGEAVAEKVAEFLK